MVRYIVLLKFTEQGAKNIQKSTARAAAFRETAAKVGATVEAQYWTTGFHDGALVFNAENESAALRCIAALAAAGNVRTQTLRAFDTKEFEAISGK